LTLWSRFKPILLVSTINSRPCLSSLIHYLCSLQAQSFSSFCFF
jgi:hypothetical protein